MKKTPFPPVIVPMRFPVPEHAVRSIGNADWQGAYLAMTDWDNAVGAVEIARRITRLDLSANHVYAAEFIKQSVDI